MGERRIPRPASASRWVWAVLAVTAGSIVGNSLAASSASPIATAGAAPDRCADANGDGAVTLSDGVQALRTAVGLRSTCNDFRCDVDGSGAITISDGIGILRRAADLPSTGTYECPVPTQVQHLSGFARFQLTRRNGLGFCPDPGSVLDVRMERQPDGSYLLQLTVAEERTAGDPACVYPFESSAGRCIAASVRPDRVLTADELKRVRKAFGTLQIFEAPLSLCEIRAFDPCVVNVLEWDELGVTDHECDAPRIERALVASLTTMLDGLIVPDASVP